MGAPFYVAQVRESKLLRSFELHSLHVPVNYQSPTSPNATGWPVYLPVFAPLSFLSSCSSCNLWLNGPSPVTSTFHFDSYNNFLCMYDSEFEIVLPANKSVTFTSPCPQTNPSHSPLDYRFAGSKTVHLRPPSSHHNCHPWSHSPNAATTITRSLLMQSSLKLTAELQHVGPLIRSMCVISRITYTAVRFVHPLCRRATSALFQRAGGTRSAPIPPSLP